MENEPFFTDDELQRYSRHITLPEFTIEGQKRLKNASVLIIGTGGLGCPTLLYLAAAGVGTIGIVDFDVVDLSNLQRQVLFTLEDIGKPKAICAAERLAKLNPAISIIPIQQKLTSENALNIIKDYDLVADGSDNFPTRYLVNDACVLLNKPNVHGSIFRFEGQVSVFNFLREDGSRGPNYRDIYPTPPPPGLVQSCAEGGVLGVLPGIIGSIQASETLKVLAKIGDPLDGRLFIFDALSFETRVMKIKKNPSQSPISSLIDYPAFCGMTDFEERKSNDLTALELKELMEKDVKNIQLIDVRESWEYKQGNIGGISLPIGKIENHIDEISQAGKIVLICRSGSRSQKALDQLKKLGFENLFNLKGGLQEWVKNVDSKLTLA